MLLQFLTAGPGKSSWKGETVEALTKMQYLAMCVLEEKEDPDRVNSRVQRA